MVGNLWHVFVRVSLRFMFVLFVDAYLVGSAVMDFGSLGLLPASLGIK